MEKEINSLHLNFEDLTKKSNIFGIMIEIDNKYDIIAILPKIPFTHAKTSSNIPIKNMQI